MNEKEPI